MGEKSVAHPGPQPIPLLDVEITWARDAHFYNEEGPQNVTIQGAELAAVLSWMSRAAPGQPTRFSEPEFLASTLNGFGAMCRVLGENRCENPDDARAIFEALGTVLDDYSTRIAVQGDYHTAGSGKAALTIKPTATHGADRRGKPGAA